MGTVTIFLCGDVMTGRGVDQVLPHPGDARLHEEYVKDARQYVRLAEAASGPIPRRADLLDIWGDALEELARISPGARLAGIDVCALANNHVLDFGEAGLLETIDTLAAVGVRGAGAGRTLAEAREPARVGILGEGRLFVFAFGDPTSGIPSSWAATDDAPGIDVLPDLLEATAGEILERVRSVKQARDIVVASIHWGSNWGYQIPAAQQQFARWLLDGGVDIVHGHSSHHARPIELYRGKLILYGCGDFLDDYEGIVGYEEFRGDLALRPFGAQIKLTDDGTLALRPS